MTLLLRPRSVETAGGAVDLVAASIRTIASVLDPDVVSFEDAVQEQKVIVGGTLPDELLDAAFGPVGRVYKRVDIYDPDGTSLWMYDAPVVAGEVTVDMSRIERRTFEATFDNEDGALSSDPERFWYSKIIKVWRGVETDALRWETQVGEFVIDRIEQPHFPSVVQVTARDYSKFLSEPFDRATQFLEGSLIEDVVRGIASPAGITKFMLPSTGKRLTRDFMYEANKARSDAIKEILDAYGYEFFFTPSGNLTIRPWVDPFTASSVFTFRTGVDGNIADYSKSTNDSNVKNRVLVVGKSSDRPPVYAVVENREPTSPTNVDQLRPRTYPFESAFITEYEDALALAKTLLSIHALESYEVTISALVVPWLEAGTAVEFIDPNPAKGAPTRYLLTDFTIPLGPGVMSATAKRITYVKAQEAA